VDSPRTFASRLLRAGLLEDVSVLSAGAPAASAGEHDEVWRAVRAACAELGASLLEWDPAQAPGRTDVVVFDGAGAFAACGPQGTGAGQREALDRCMELAWELTRAVVDSAPLSAGWAGRIIYIAPRRGAGAHADAARAGLENLARTLSIEWARHGVTTVAIAPGEDTPAEEIGALTAYLASPAGAYFSGCLLDLAGPGGTPVSLPE